jgi:hypothetical protein
MGDCMLRQSRTDHRIKYHFKREKAWKKTLRDVEGSKGLQNEAHKMKVAIVKLSTA